MKFSVFRNSSCAKVFRPHLLFFILLYLTTCVFCIMTGVGEINTHSSSLPNPGSIQNHRQDAGIIVPAVNITSRQYNIIETKDAAETESRELQLGTGFQKDVSKRNAIVNENARSYFYPGGGGGYGTNGEVFCYDRYVKGNCRYRTDPSECFSYEWTAYATIHLRGGIANLYSIPDGLYLPDLQGNVRDKVRVFLKVSCCTPVVQFISTGAWRTQENACVVDVRELQGLHPGEIAGIVIAAVVLLIIIIVIIVLIVKKRRRDQMPVLVGRAHVGPASSRDREMTRQ